MDALRTRPGLIRLAALAVWTSVGAFMPFCPEPAPRTVLTIMGLLTFGGLLWAATADRMSRRMTIGLLLGQTAAAILLLVCHPFLIVTGLLVIVGWQAALLLPVAPALAWIVVQTLVAGALLARRDATSLLVTSLGVTIGFQVFALACADLARLERQTRHDRDEALRALAEAQSDLIRRERHEERLRIARDLHDELGHGLTAIGLTAASMEVAAADHAVGAQFGELKRAASALLGRVRCVVSASRESVLGEGKIDLARALRAVGDGGPGQLRLRLDIAGDVAAVEAERAVAILRLVQEATTNARRHGGPGVSGIAVRVQACADRIDVTVSDDGAGASEVTLGNGLTGMKERLARVGGSLCIATTPGRGCRLVARLPLPAA